MNFSGHLLLLANRAEVLRGMGSGFREKRETFQTTDLLWWGGGALLVALIISALVWWITLGDKSRFFNSPRGLFRSLCKLHGLDGAHSGLLWQLARSQKLPAPAQIFLTPESFDPASVPPELRPYQSTINALRARLFALMDASKSRL